MADAVRELTREQQQALAPKTFEVRLQEVENQPLLTLSHAQQLVTSLLNTIQTGQKIEFPPNSSIIVVSNNRPLDISRGFDFARSNFKEQDMLEGELFTPGGIGLVESRIYPDDATALVGAIRQFVDSRQEFKQFVKWEPDLDILFEELRRALNSPDSDEQKKIYLDGYIRRHLQPALENLAEILAAILQSQTEQIEFAGIDELLAAILSDPIDTWKTQLLSIAQAFRSAVVNSAAITTANVNYRPAQVRELLNSVYASIEGQLANAESIYTKALSAETKQLFINRSAYVFTPLDLDESVVLRGDATTVQNIIDLYTRMAEELVSYVPSEAPAATAEEAETEEGGEVPEPTPTPTQLLNVEEMWAAAQSNIAEQLIAQLTSELDLSGFDEQQVEVLFNEIRQLIETFLSEHQAELVVKIQNVIEAQQADAAGDTSGAAGGTSGGAPVFDQETQRFVISAEQFASVQNELLAAILAEYGAELGAAVAAAGAAATPPPPPTTEETEAGAVQPGQAAIPGAVLDRLRSADQSDIDQYDRNRALTGDQIKTWLYLRNEYAAQFGFAFEIDPNLESLLTGEIAALVIPLGSGQISTLVKQDLWLKLTNNQALRFHLDSIYRQHLPQLSNQLKELVGDGVDILKITTNVDILLTLAGDDARFIDSLSLQMLNSYFGLSVKTPEELAAWKNFLHVYVPFRRFQLAYDKKIYLRTWSDGQSTEFGHQQINQHYNAVATFLTHAQLPGSHEQRLAAVTNTEQEDEVGGTQEITLGLRREIFVTYMGLLSDEERAAFYNFYQVIDGDDRESLVLPPGFSYSQHINQLVSGAIPGMERAGKKTPSAHDRAAGAIGKATRALVEKLGPQALVASKALQLLGLDDEKLGKIIEAITLAVGTVLGVLGYLFTHSLGFLVGAGVGGTIGFIISGGNPLFALGSGLTGGFAGLALEKQLFGKGSWLAQAASNIGNFFSGAGTGVSNLLAGAKNFLGGVGGFGAGAAVGGAFGLSALFNTFVSNPSTTGSFLHPLTPDTASGISAIHKASGKICWPGDGIITSDDSGYYAVGKPHYSFINGQPAKNVAIDIGVGDGEPIYAPFSGTVEIYPMFVGPFGGFAAGNYAILRGDNGYNAGFFHLHFKTLSYWLGRKNKQVNVQDVIAFADNTGNSRGAHLHYEALNGPLSAIMPGEVESVVNSSPHQSISHTTCVDNSGGEEINEDFQGYCSDAGAAPSFSPAVSGEMVQKFLPAPLDDDGVTEIKACHRPSQLVIHWSGSGSAEATYQRILQRRRGCAFTTDSTQIIQMQPLGTDKIATGICSHQNDSSIDIEIAGRCFSLDSSRTGECDNLSTPQPPSTGNLANAVALAKDIMRIYGISCANVKGHYQTAPNGDPRDDPGKQWMNSVFRPAIGCSAQY